MSLGGVIGNLKGNDIGRRGPDLKIFDVTDDAQTGQNGMMVTGY